MINSSRSENCLWPFIWDRHLYEEIQRLSDLNFLSTHMCNIEIHEGTYYLWNLASRLLTNTNLLPLEIFLLYGIIDDTYSIHYKFQSHQSRQENCQKTTYPTRAGLNAYDIQKQ